MIIVNQKLAERLFGTSDPIDKTINVDGVGFTVIGVYHYTASPMGTPTSAGGGDQAKAIVPFESARRALNPWMRGVDFIVKPEPGVTTAEATDDVTALMRARRGLRSTAKNNFEIVTQDRLMGIYNKLFGTFFVVGIALSSVGLLVGGVGVVAIMMISVTERTREIGVRKALGATKSAILWHPVEAATPPESALDRPRGDSGPRSNQDRIPGHSSFPPLSPCRRPRDERVHGDSVGLLPAARPARLDPVKRFATSSALPVSRRGKLERMNGSREGQGHAITRSAPRGHRGSPLRYCYSGARAPWSSHFSGGPLALAVSSGVDRLQRWKVPRGIAAL